jgi:iron complex outermembrane receptor protein
MYNKKNTIIFCLLLISFFGIGQDGTYNLQGKVFDEGSQSPLSFVNVIIQEISRGSTTDEGGMFGFEKVCAGEYNLIFSHLGCEPKEMHIHIDKDTFINIALVHSSISLDGVVIEGKSNHIDSPSKTVGKQSIEDNSDKNLSSLLAGELGVQVLKNGGGISKPVIHGLFGNRLLILNNGVLQGGQQWGNDHSPEIDPMVANRITVIKGTNALEYGGGNLGSVILIEPKKVGRDPHLHGRANYAYESNGRGNNINFQLQKFTQTLGWKLNATFKKVGDRQSPNYFLTNTGTEETNFALQLEKAWNDKFFMDFYASSFNTELGILRGSHIGNLTDLEDALKRDIPFFTENEFSYSIVSPKQVVGHHLIKLNTQYYFNQKESLKLIIAGQLNDRKEFDVRRSGRSNIPALSLRQYTYSSDLKYYREFENEWKLKIGNQNIYTDNTNNPETGILPLIPDYLSIKSGLFTTIIKEWSRLDLNMGIRYDYGYQNVVTITNSTPKEIVRYRNNFHNISGTTGIGYNFSKSNVIKLNTGYTTRNPAINELYSSGLHQGVSGIEEGSQDLKTEKAWKTTLDYTASLSSKFSFGALIYYQRFEDYIFLQPQDEFRLTIRGAFPLFQYEQTDAEIYGLDLTMQLAMGKSLLGEMKYSFIKGNDVSNSLPLVNIPSNSLDANITYRVNKSIQAMSLKIEDLEFELNNRYVFRQSNLNPDQDFVLPPNAYNLFGFKMSANIIQSKYKLRWFFKIENLLDVSYRDYLNRQRYFADDLGRSTTVGVNFSF